MELNVAVRMERRGLLDSSRSDEELVTGLTLPNCYVMKLAQMIDNSCLLHPIPFNCTVDNFRSAFVEN
ncbi:hypothetical protein E2C01_036150 [Portunus trituberculatus]|uniref:Uncharacterized protein n=1 Tax=Portunus trituberculatus TaxID=210409 RepID=A0A5B7FBP7_PORTR|nr:hypothetical protein [Portunus trituberculatus]